MAIGRGELISASPSPLWQLGNLHDSAAFRSFVAQNTVESLAFLGLALTAGFVEEFAGTVPGLHSTRL